MAANTIPVTVSPEAHALATQLGYQTQISQMIEWVVQTFPNLQGIEVARYDLIDEPESPRIVITVSKAGRRDNDDRQLRRREWTEWTWATFSPPVYGTVALEIVYPDERNARSRLS